MIRGHEVSFFNLLSSIEGQLVVPIYQRGYTWKDDDRKYFFGHIEKLHEHEVIRNHYCHAILTKEYHVKDGFEFKQTAIIDGQQRITTASLFYAALCAYCKHNKIDFDWRNKIYYKVLVNMGEKGGNKYKLKLKEEDKDTYELIIDDLPVNLSTNGRSKNIIKTYLYFLKQFNLYNWEQLFDNFKKFTIGNDIAEDKDSAELLFETVNFGGSKLEQYHLIRSYTLLNMDTDAQEKYYYKYWTPIFKTFNNDDKKMDSFVNSFCAYKMNNVEVNKKGLEFIRFYERTNHDKLELLNDLEDYFNKYIMIYNKDPGIEEVDKSLDVILSMKTPFAYPMIIRLYDYYIQNHMSVDEFIKVIRLLEVLMVRNKICNPGNFAITFRRIYKKIKINKNNVYDSIYNAFSQTKYFYDDDTFKRDLITSNFYKDYSPDSFRFKFLEYLENSYYPNGYVSLKSKYSIEHILPQNIEDTEWMQSLGDNAIEIAKINCNKLGNLTLTAYNSNLSNKSFEEKLNNEKGYKNDRLQLNNSVICYEEWNEFTIRERGEELANRAVKMWSYPTTLQGKEDVNSNSQSVLMVDGK